MWSPDPLLQGYDTRVTPSPLDPPIILTRLQKLRAHFQCAIWKMPPLDPLHMDGLKMIILNHHNLAVMLPSYKLPASDHP